MKRIIYKSFWTSAQMNGVERWASTSKWIELFEWMIFIWFIRFIRITDTSVNFICHIDSKTHNIGVQSNKTKKKNNRGLSNKSHQSLIIYWFSLVVYIFIIRNHNNNNRKSIKSRHEWYISHLSPPRWILLSIQYVIHEICGWKSAHLRQIVCSPINIIPVRLYFFLVVSKYDARYIWQLRELVPILYDFSNTK